MLPGYGLASFRDLPRGTPADFAFCLAIYEPIYLPITPPFTCPFFLQVFILNVKGNNGISKLHKTQQISTRKKRKKRKKAAFAVQFAVQKRGAAINSLLTAGHAGESE